jgi:hypothetical protein
VGVRFSISRALLLGLSLFALVGTPAVADEGDDLSVKEKVGELRLSTSAATVKKLLGPPSRKSKVVPQDADGAFIQHWEYAAQGISIEMAAISRKGAQKVASIDVRAPCTLKTARGIAVGSPVAELTRAYGAERNAEESTAERFVAGSIYGGVLFGLKDGRVETTFVGAAAE